MPLSMIVILGTSCTSFKCQISAGRSFAVMSGGNDQWLRTPAARTLLLAALTISLVLGIGFVAINTSPDTAVSALGKSAPLTDDQSRAQVIESARQIVTIAQLRDVNGSYVFLSCTNEHDPPYQAALYLNFPLPDANSVRYIRDIAAAMAAHGWQGSPSIGEHFGLKLSREGVSSTFHENPDARFGTMRIYGECRNMADHRNDNPAWKDITDQLS